MENINMDRYSLMNEELGSLLSQTHELSENLEALEKRFDDRLSRKIEKTREIKEVLSIPVDDGFAWIDKLFEYFEEKKKELA